ncbi:MAG: polyphosphate kinase [Massilia sp.]|nr:polyphosphate kinase [Massilia sp.]
MKLRERLRAGKNFKLREEDADDKPLRDRNNGESKSAIKEDERAATVVLTDKIAVLQEMLFAQKKYKVLLVLQGMDTSGKDGTITSLFHGINPMGLRAVGFKAPSPAELAHDFLWRVHACVPGWGEITIFNRSHYEDVLITSVQGMIDDQEVKRRYQHILDFERMLSETGTVIVKLFLHISKDEQKARLQARIDDPLKQWKFDPNDLVQREKWDEYQQAYQRAIVATDTDQAPWYVIPANSKAHRDLLVASLLLEIMEDLDLHYPEPRPDIAKIKVK